MTSTSPLETLRTILRDAAALGGPAGSAHALGAVRAYLLDEGFSEPEVEPLFRLWLALADHAEGKPNPLLSRVRRDGNRSHQADLNFKICVASTMTMLVRLGKSKREAAEIISRSLRSDGVQVRPTSVDSWHREISSNRHPDPSVLKSYNENVDAIARQADPRRAVASAVRGLSVLLREKI